METGRAAPSRDMVLKLAERLEVPLRERNVLLVAAGFAPAFPQRSLDDPALKSARAAIDLVLKAHEPNPALAYDRHWNLVSANRMVMPLLEGVPARLLGQPFNILRLAFHPEALAARTVNLAEWCAHLLERLHRQCEATADPELIKLYQELKAYPIPARSAPLSADNVAIPFKMRLDGEVLSFMSTTMIFGTPVDITLSELALETFFPADELTAERHAADGGRPEIAALAGARIAAYLWAFRKGGRAHEHPETAADRHRLRRGVPVVLYRQAPHRERAGAGAGRAGRDATGGRSSSIPGCRARASAATNISPRSSARSRPTRASPGASSRRPSEEGLVYRPELVKRQPNTIDCHRLIHWAEAKGKSAEMKQRLMELYFRDGGDLTDIDVLVQAAADCGLDADDVRQRLATDEDVALISAQARRPPTRASPACRPSCSRRNTRCPARSRPNSSPAPSARSRRR